MLMHDVAAVYNDVQLYGIFLKHLVRWQIFFQELDSSELPYYMGLTVCIQ